MVDMLMRRIIVIILAVCLLMCSAACSAVTEEPPVPVSSSDEEQYTEPEPDTDSDAMPAWIAADMITSHGGIGNSGFEDSSSTCWTWNDYSEIAVRYTDEFCYEGNCALETGADSVYEVRVRQYVSGMAPGYYYAEVYALNEGGQDFCYVYGRGSNQGECMTAVPRTIREGEWTKVTVRGIEVGEDGFVELGIHAAGDGEYAYFDCAALYPEADQSRQYESLFGGAISWLDWVEDLGGKYYREDGTEADALQIMAENGCNFVRLELYNNPGDYINNSGDAFPAGYKDADAIFDLAVRAHAKGMKIQLSFMYADYWGNEAIPSDWLARIRGISDNEEIAQILSDCLYEYTKDFMQRLADAGIYPEYVSIGNEMNGGILLPYGCTYTTQTALDSFCSFMDAGYRAIKEVSPDSQVVLHIACNADDMFWESGIGTGRWFFDICKDNGIKYDIIGTSYYPYWAQSYSEYALKRALDVNDLVNWCNMMIDTYDKDILVMESGINWGTPGQLSNNGAYQGIYNYTPEDQRDFMFELINGIKSVQDGRCIGDLYWDPVLVRQPGVGWAVRPASGTSRENCVETTTFFDYDHVALPVFDAYRYNIAGDGTAVITGSMTTSDGMRMAKYSFVLSIGEDEYAVTTDRYGEFIARVGAGSGKLAANGVDAGFLTVRAGEHVIAHIVVER